MRIEKFAGVYFFLSNFYPCTVTYKGITYQNSECAFQAQKVNHEDRHQFANLSARDGKKLGRKVRIRGSWFFWTFNREKFMYEVVKAKFDQHPDLKRKLLNTGKDKLIEGNTWGDDFWGKCWNAKQQCLVGENKLGKILMKLRHEYSKENKNE